jgi:hypothetical protein
LALVAGLWCAGEARAHIELISPEPRERARDRRSANSNLKRGPCGQNTNRRDGAVSVFAPGETISVSFTEYVNHTGYYRVAFDVDGDDGFPVFSGRNVSEEGDEPLVNCPVDGNVILAYDFEDRMRGVHTLDVTLPDVECDTCTLQVIQFMYGSPRPYYFQCADIALRRQADAGAGTSAVDAGGRDAGPTPDRSTFRAAASCWADLDALASSAPQEQDTNTQALPQGSNDAPSPDSSGSTLSGASCSLPASAQAGGALGRSAALVGSLWLATRRRSVHRRSAFHRAAASTSGGRGL